MKDTEFFYSNGKNLKGDEKIYYEVSEHFMRAVAQLLEKKIDGGVVSGGDVFDVMCRLIGGMLANVPQLFKQLEKTTDMQAIIFEVAQESLKAALDVYSSKITGTLQ